MRWRARLPVALGTWLLMLLACCACASALDPSRDLSQYAHAAWKIQDGSVPGAVRAITQTPDGYIWLGTEFGVTRFDGVRFVSWNPPSGQHLPSTNIRSLLAGRDGTLWIGTQEGLASWKDGKLTAYPEFSHQNVLTLLQDHEGTVWAGTFRVPRGNLCAIQNGKAQCYGDDGRLGQWVWSIYEDGERRLWVGAQTGLWRWNPGPAQRFPIPHRIETAQALVGDDSGQGLLAVTEGIWQFVEEKTRPYEMASPTTRFTPVCLFRDRDGGLWVGTLQRGIMHVRGDKTSVFAEPEGLTADHVLAFFEDREGNIWVGTVDGLDLFRERSVYPISTKEGLSAPSVVSVLAASDNSVWLSTIDGLNRWKDGRVTIYWPAGPGGKQRVRPFTNRPGTAVFYKDGKAVTEIDDPGLPDTTVGSLYEDDHGRVWVSTPKGISRFENGKFWEVKEVPGGWVNAITADGSTGIWISDQDLGLLHWSDDKVIEKIPWSRLGGNVIASAVVPDPVRGGLWLGFFGGGLVHVKDGEVRESYGNKEGLGTGRVMHIQLDKDGTIWASTEGGLSHLKNGNIVTLTSANGLPCDTVHWAVEADSAFWLYTTCGLLQIPRQELEKWAANPASNVRFTVLDRADGVRKRALLAGYTPRVSKSKDGRLWFADLERLSVLDPAHLVVNKTPPPVYIEQVIGDGISYLPRRGVPRGEVRLPPRVRDLTIDYTALSFAVPEKVRFKYKLEGQDPDWKEVVNKREVQYSNLPPRKYRFRVIASNSSGVWNEQGDTVDFSIAPAYYQTNWFAAVCAALFIATIWILHQLRLRRVARQFNLTVEARVGERTRIARELHDTLLQSFHGLLFRFQSVSQLLPDRPLDAKHRLDSTIDQAAEAITEARDAVQGLRSSTFGSNELALTLKALGQELAINEANPTSPHFSVEVFGIPHELDPMVRDEVYRIAAQALQNAFSHARAQRIELEIRYEDRELVLRVHDDGKGIDPQVLSGEEPVGHYGLAGMHERAKLVAAKLEIWSEIGAGTEIQLTIPAATAYMDFLQRGRWIQKLSRKGLEKETKIQS